MKRALFVLMAIFFATVLYSQITLKVWESNGPEKYFINYVGREFKKTHPNVTVEFVEVESSQAGVQAIQKANTPEAPDIFMAPHDNIGNIVEANIVLPLDNPEETLKNFLPTARNVSYYKGTAYGYPLAAETYVLFYNKKILPRPPKTWDEIIKFAKSFTNSAQDKYALVWEVGNAYYGYMFLHTFDAPLFGPNGDDPTQHNINSEGAIEGLKYFQNLRKYIGDVPSATLKSDYFTTKFKEGKAAMCITGPWDTNAFKNSGMYFGITTLPEFTGTNHPANSFCGFRLVFVNKYSKSPNEAKELAKLMTSRTALQKRYELTDQIPPRTDINTRGEYSAGITKQLRYAIPMPVIPQIRAFWDYINPAFAKIWDGSDVESTLNNAGYQMDQAK